MTNRTYYSVDRTPSLGHAKLEAWTVLQARNEFVRADPGHREAVTQKEAGVICRGFHGVSLSEDRARGLV